MAMGLGDIAGASHTHTLMHVKSAVTSVPKHVAKQGFHSWPIQALGAASLGTTWMGFLCDPRDQILLKVSRGCAWSVECGQDREIRATGSAHSSAHLQLGFCSDHEATLSFKMRMWVVQHGRYLMAFGCLNKSKSLPS